MVGLADAQPTEWPRNRERRPKVTVAATSVVFNVTSAAFISTERTAVSLAHQDRVDFEYRPDSSLASGLDEWRTGGRSARRACKNAATLLVYKAICIKEATWQSFLRPKTHWPTMNVSLYASLRRPPTRALTSLSCGISLGLGLELKCS